MSPEQQQKAFVLRSLGSVDQRAMVEDALAAYIQVVCRQYRVTRSEAIETIRHCERMGWIISTEDPILGRLWGLTPEGRLQLSRLS
jgi:hypothetical protein